MSVSLAWEHCTKLKPNSTNDLVCKFCGHISRGGITRFKQHLIGGHRNTKRCPIVSEELKARLQDLVLKEANTRGVNVVENTFRSAYATGKEVEQANSDDEEEFLGEGGSQKDVGRGSGPMDKFVYPTKKRKVSVVQTTISSKMKSKERDELAQSLSLWMYRNCISFNVVQDPLFKETLEKIGRFGAGFKAPTYHEVREKFLIKEVEKTDDLINEHKKVWAMDGCSIMSDGWTDKRHRTLVNFCVNSSKGTVFMRAVDASSYKKTGAAIFKLFDQWIREIGPHNVVQIVKDNAKNYGLAKTMMEQRYPHIFATGCATHCLDLILEDFSKKMPIVQRTVKTAQSITTYIYNHTLLVDVMKEFTNGRDLVRPGATRFATNFLTLQCLLTQKHALRSMFASPKWYESDFAKTNEGQTCSETIYRQSFWKNVAFVMKISLPIVKVLRIVDGDLPPMEFIYEAMERAKIGIKNTLGGQEKKYKPIWKIIDKRWDDNLHSPLHAAGYYLNPQLFYPNARQILPDAEVCDGFTKCVEKILPSDIAGSLEFSNEISNYTNARGSFQTKMAINTRDKQPPVDWWLANGSSSPTLQHFAVRILSLTCSASGCERTWSTFENNKKHPGDPKPRLFTVGRLDVATTGLIIVTNDGEFAQKLSHPSSNMSKEYIATVEGEVNKRHMNALSEGTTIEGVQCTPDLVELLPKQPDISRRRLRIVVHEGRNHEVREIVKNAGLEIHALKRVRIGGFRLPSDLSIGKHVELKAANLRTLGWKK